MVDPIKYANRIGLGGACLAIGIVVGAERRSLPPIVPDIKYSDLIAVILSALGVILAVLAIFIAILAVFGWRTFEQRLKDHSINYFKEELGREGKLRSEFEDLIVAIGHEGIEKFKRQEGIPPDDPHSQQEERYDD
jgi:hypothetical protein